MEHLHLPALIGTFMNHFLYCVLSFKQGAYPMEHLHLPAVTERALPEKRAGLEPTHWLTPEAGEGYYPAALFSYYHWQRQQFAFPDDVYLFGDSGGYSVASLGAEIDPRDSLRWQIQNCAVGVILDIPPFALMGGAPSLSAGVLGGRAATNWGPAIQGTLRNTRATLPLYLAAREEGTRFRWWGVIHGETLQQLEEWYQAVNNLYPFQDEGEGWAVSPKPTNNTRAIAQALGFLGQKGITRTHLLGGLGLSGLLTAALLGRQAGIEFMSFDSSSSMARGLRRAIIVPDPDGLAFSELTENYRDKGETGARDYLLGECTCWSCGAFRRDLDKQPAIAEDHDYVMGRMIFHNHLITVRILDNLFGLSDADGHAYLKARLGSKRYQVTMRAYEGTDPRPIPVGTPRSLLDMI